MASYVNTDGFQESRYFARSWALCTREPGWIKRLFVLWLAGLVPIAGALGMQGYFAEWARLIAWGASTSPARNGGSVGAYIRSGWRMFLVAFVWGLLWGLIVILISITPLVSSFFAVVAPIVSFVLVLIIRIAAVRATIYQSTGAGFKFSTIGQMAERDAGGLLRILAIQFIGSLILGLISAVAFTIAVTPYAGDLQAALQEFVRLADSGMTQYSSYRAVEFLLLRILSTLLLPVSITGFITSFFAIMLETIIFIALGLWMRQFNVPAWGGSDDPLPAGLPAYVPVPTQYVPYDPYAANTPPNQVPYAYGDTDYGLQTHGGVGQAQATHQEGSQNHYPQG